jgi:hypothetical protein
MGQTAGPFMPLPPGEPEELAGIISVNHTYVIRV